MPPVPGQGTSRGVPRGRDGGGCPDLRNRPLNLAAPPAPRYNVKGAELERMIRHARLTHSGSFGFSPSSSGTSHATQHSHHSHHSHRSHASLHASRHDGYRHGSGMARDIATVVGMGRAIGVVPEPYLFPVAYGNSNVDVRSLSSSACSKWSITFRSLECRKGSM